MKKGKHYYNNGVIQIILGDEDTIPEGFKPGGLPKNRKSHTTHNAGKICINNGEINQYIDSSELDSYIVKGWMPGKFLNDASKENWLEKTKQAHLNRSEKEIKEEHIKRSQSAVNMWNNRSQEEKSRIGKLNSNKAKEKYDSLSETAKREFNLKRGKSIASAYEQLSETDKLIRASNISNGLINWNKALTDEQRAARSVSNSLAQLNRSDEEKELTRLKLKESLANMSDDAKQQRHDRMISAIESRSEEKKLEISLKLSIAGKLAVQNRDSNVESNRRLKISTYWKNMSADERNKILEKRSLAANNHTVEQKQIIRDKYINTCRLNKSFVKTKLEKRVEEFLINNKFTYQGQYNIYKENVGSHSFDYAIFDNHNLIMLIDCDGIYFHGYDSDETGTKVNTYTDDYRSLLVPENVKFITIIEGYEQEGYNQIFKLINQSYDDYINEIFNWCRSFKFPYLTCSDNVINASYKSLCNSDTSKFNVKCRYGDKVISYFHKSIYNCNLNGKLSPFDAWNNDELLLKCIKNRIIYKGHDLYPEKVLAGFTVAKIAPKISIFNANLARYIIDKYLSEYEVIFDPFSGYSGRMLGCCSLNKYYIGQDINKITIDESNQIKEFLNLNAQLSCKDIINDFGSYDCLFTCPPYNNKEIWNMPLENKSCDEWIDICINNYNCNKYIFVVDSTIKYNKYITEELINKSHFGSNSEYIIVIER